MNFLVINSAPGHARALVEMLITDGDAGTIDVFCHTGSANYAGVEARYHDVHAATFGEFPADELTAFPAIDARLLDRLLDCESAYLVMQDKNEKYAKYLSSREAGRYWRSDAPNLSYPFHARKLAYLRCVRHAYGLLTTRKIGCVVISVIPNHGYDLVYYYVAKLLGIPTFTFDYLPFIGRILPRSTLFDPEPAVNAAYDRISRMGSVPELPGPVKEFLDFHLDASRDPVPVYMNPAKIDQWEYVTLKPNWRDRLAVVRAVFSIAARLAVRRSLSAVWPLALPVILKLKKEYERAHLREAYVSLERASDKSVPYIYFPLHYQPEISTSPHGGHYVEPTLIALLLSECMPKGWMLYVKEHPFQRSLGRLSEQYRQMVDAGNVRLVPIEESTYALMQNARAVATVTGTPGMEALVRGRPVLAFGQTFYSLTPGCYRVRDRADLVNALTAINAGAPTATHDQIASMLLANWETGIHGAITGAFAQHESAAQAGVSQDETFRSIGRYVLEALKRGPVESVGGSE